MVLVFVIQATSGSSVMNVELTSTTTPSRDAQVCVGSRIVTQIVLVLGLLINCLIHISYHYALLLVHYTSTSPNVILVSVRYSTSRDQVIGWDDLTNWDPFSSRLTPILYKSSWISPFAACDCDPEGSESQQCDESGQCQCKGTVQGRRCDSCPRNMVNVTLGCVSKYTFVQNSFKLPKIWNFTELMNCFWLVPSIWEYLLCI